MNVPEATDWIAYAEANLAASKLLLEAGVTAQVHLLRGEELRKTRKVRKWEQSLFTGKRVTG